MSSALDAAALRARDAEVSSRAQRVFDRPLVVEAGAGTGKTTLLVARCVAWSLRNGWESAERKLGSAEPDRIAAEVLSRVAALTFTEAAAAEMSKRVGDAFAAIARGKVPDGVDGDGLPPERAARATALLGALDRLVVRTLHAFCRRLLARHALEAGLHPLFEVDADERGRAAVAREVTLAAVEAGYGDPGDPDLLALALLGDGPPQLETALGALLGSGIGEAALAVDPLAPERIRAWRDALAAQIDRFDAGARSRLAATAARSGRTRETLDALAATRLCIQREIADAGALAARVEELKSLWDEKFVERLGEWAADDFNASERKALGDASGEAASLAAPLHAAIVHALALDPARLALARRVLARLLADARERMRRQGLLAFDELLHRARELLREHASARRQVRRELDQILVDEFQDTDRVQCEILRWIALDGPAAERPGLFLVGDPKQLIYGWREADLAAYEAFVREALGPGGEPDRLGVNRRSTPPILAEVARVIEPTMRARAGVQPAFQPLVASEAREREAGPVGEGRAAVEHWITWEWDPEAGAQRHPKAREAAQREAAAIAGDLVRLHASGEIAWRDAGILLRARGDLELYLQALRVAGVPYAVEKDRSYYGRREVIDASALVACVLDPDDRLALLTWLRSPSVGVPDAALLPLFAQGLAERVAALTGPDEGPLAELGRSIEAARVTLPPDVPGLGRVVGWEHALRHALAAVAALRASFARDAADLFVEKLRTLTLVEVTEAARYVGAYRLANLERFFRELREQLEAEDVDVPALLRRLRSDVAEERQAEDARPLEAVEDAVRVMTIHQAKGLQFRHCYLAQLHKGRRRGADPAPFAAKALAGGIEYRLCGVPTLGHAAIEAAGAEVEAAEQVRALYVAMTRARDRLVLLGDWDEGAGEAAAPEAARSHAQLLASRAGERPDLAQAMARAQREGRDAEVGPDGVLWRFPALRAPEAAEPEAEPETAKLPSARAIEADGARLTTLRAKAGARMRRPFRASASADAHDQAREQDAARRFPASELGPAVTDGETAAEVARAAGTAVHRVLEALDLHEGVAAQLARGRDALPALALRLAPEAARAAVARAQAVLERFARGPLLGRFAGLRDAVIARELPLLIPADPEGEGPVGFVAGAIDLLYRDPATGELVVVDFKTDRVEGEAALRARAERYTGQAAHYRRAIQEALALPQPPRFELWFLYAGAVLPLG